MKQTEKSSFLAKLPWIIVALCAVYLLSKTRPATYSDNANIAGFGRLMVSLDGRLQPLDSVARNSLLVVSRVSLFKSDFLRPHQVSDWHGLANALLTDESKQAAHIRSLMTADQRVLFNSVEGASEEIVEAQEVHLLEAINYLLDDLRRQKEIDRHNLELADDATPLKYAPFYVNEAWADAELSPEHKYFLDRLNTWQAIEDKSNPEPQKVVSQPEIIEFNRQLFSDVFDDYVSASSAKREPALVWMLDTMARPRYAEHHRVFRIVHPEVLSFLGLPERERFRYAFSEFDDSFEKLETESEVISSVPVKERDPYQKGIMEIYGQVMQYRTLKFGWRPFWQPPISAGQDWGTIKGVVTSAQDDIGAQIRGNPKVLAYFEGLEKEELTDQNFNLGLAKFNLMPTEDTQRVMRMLLAYNENDIATFNTLVKEHNERLVAAFDSETARTGYEVFFNQFSVFYYCVVLYIMAFLCVVVSWLLAQTKWREPLLKAGFYIILLTLVAHTYGIISRMYLHERPPITNLYATGIFIGWAAAIVAAIIEKITKLGFGTVVAATVGALTGIISINLAADGDTLEMQQAVLDTNFWLATHVTAINIGYAATFLAGALGIVFILGGVFTRDLNKETRKILTQMIYGVVCFALLFSFVGTVLGGIWADQSWGRFWGWDPKENGALMIVIANALVLHARWAGMVKQRGVANLAVFGNIITAWSWFGTNQLGVGLHAYGFTDTATFYILLFVCSQLVVMAIGMTPLRTWRSYQDQLEQKGKPGIHGMVTGAAMIALFVSLFMMTTG